MNPWAAPNLLPDKRIDYIFIAWPKRGGIGSVTAVRRTGLGQPHEVVPSDHYAVVADLRY